MAGGGERGPGVQGSVGPGTGLGGRDVRGHPLAVQRLLRTRSWGCPRPLAQWLGPWKAQAPLGLEIRGHAPRGVTTSPPPCAPWGPCAVASQMGDRQPWLPAFCPRVEALGGHRCVRRRVGMGRAAAGSSGRCRQRCGLPGRRRQRRPAPGRRKASTYRRRRARPRRKEPCPKSLGQVQRGASDSGCCVVYQEPVHVGPLHPPAASSAHWAPGGGNPTCWGT